MSDPIIYRHRRTVNDHPPPGLYEGEIAYSDRNHTLHIGRPKVGGVRDIGAAACYVLQQYPIGTSGGTFLAGDWRKRSLTTLQGNTSFCEILNGSLLLQPGTYEVAGHAVALSVKCHMARLINPDDQQVLIWGSTAYCYAEDYVETRSFLVGTFELSDQALVSLEHRCQLSRPDWGFGYRSGFGPETYVQLTLHKY